MAYVHAGRGTEDLPRASPAGDAERSNRAPGRSRDDEDRKSEEGGEEDHDGKRAPQELDEPARALLDGDAEEVCRVCPEQAASRHRVASVPPAVRPLDRFRPLGLEVRAGRAVEERLLELSPAALEGDPGEGLRGRGRVARDRLHDRADLAVRALRVVAADSGLRGAPEVERFLELVRVRAVRRIDDGVRTVDDLELVVAPTRALGTLVRAVADTNRQLRQCLAGIGGVEVELDHLPVALVEVVELVVDVEEPVLQRQLPGMARVGDHVRIDRGRASLGQAAVPELVVAPGVERVSRVVEVVLVAVDEVRGLWCDLHEVGRVPRAAKRHGVLAEEDVDVDRLVRFAGAAFLVLFNQAHDRREAVRKRLFVGEIRACNRREEKRGCCCDKRKHRDSSHGGCFDA